MNLKAGAKGELVFVGSLFVLGLIVFLNTWNSQLPQLNLTVSPKLFPFAVSIFLMVLSALLFVQVLRGEIAIPEGLEVGDLIEKSDFKSFLIVLTSFFAFLIAIERAGFIIAATLTFVGITIAFGERRYIRSIAIGIVFTTLIYLSFTHFLHVALPPGIFKGIL